MHTRAGPARRTAAGPAATAARSARTPPSPTRTPSPAPAPQPSPAPHPAGAPSPAPSYGPAPARHDRSPRLLLLRQVDPDHRPIARKHPAKPLPSLVPPPVTPRRATTLAHRTPSCVAPGTPSPDYRTKRASLPQLLLKEQAPRGLRPITAGMFAGPPRGTGLPCSPPAARRRFRVPPRAVLYPSRARIPPGKGGSQASRRAARGGRGAGDIRPVRNYCPERSGRSAPPPTTARPRCSPGGPAHGSPARAAR